MFEMSLQLFYALLLCVNLPFCSFQPFEEVTIVSCSFIAVIALRRISSCRHNLFEGEVTAALLVLFIVTPMSRIQHLVDLFAAHQIVATLKLFILSVDAVLLLKVSIDETLLLRRYFMLTTDGITGFAGITSMPVRPVISSLHQTIVAFKLIGYSRKAVCTINITRWVSPFACSASKHSDHRTSG